MPDAGVRDRLVADGVLEVGAGRPVPTRRWRGAVARAAMRLQAAGAPWDPRLPAAVALLSLRADLDDAEVAKRVDAMLELDPALTAGAGDG